MLVTKKEYPFIRNLILGINNATRDGGGLDPDTLKETAAMTGMSPDMITDILDGLVDLNVIYPYKNVAAWIKLTPKGLTYAGILMGM